MYEKIQSFLETYNIEPKKENARSYIFDCPACGASEKLYIEKSSGRNVCFRHKTENCPTIKTPLAKVLSEISGVAYEQVKKFFDEKITITAGEILEEPAPLTASTTLNNKTIRVPLEELKPGQYPLGAVPLTRPDALDGRNYLIKRGLEMSQLESLGVMYSPYMRRVIFPIIQDGKYYGWQARTIDESVKPRMYNLPGEWKSRTLMFHDNLKSGDFAVVAEGAVSALKFAKVGNFVATMGKTVSNEQIELLLKPWIRRVFLALDPDATPEMRDIVSKIYNKTNGLVQCFLVRVPDHREDFGDCTYEECEQAFKSAETIDPDCFVLYCYEMERGW